ncbi:hypothetical protein DB88DRAFT_520216 [Papiliotrema laurentii]|uniref:Uncharacterized protein n=1 Tax=Papiliotrema laurentii TaxID=5418 RepID=A0AAD9CRY7_PAPLA|nr:hypothetical protein DB88DRAFT_520216 [Papiliotrema laurentii]
MTSAAVDVALFGPERQLGAISMPTIQSTLPVAFVRPGKPSNQDVLEEDVTCVGKTGWETLGEMRQKNRNLPGWCRDCGCLGQVLWNDLERSNRRGEDGGRAWDIGQGDLTICGGHPGTDQSTASDGLFDALPPARLIDIGFYRKVFLAASISPRRTDTFPLPIPTSGQEPSTAIDLENNTEFPIIFTTPTRCKTRLSTDVIVVSDAAAPSRRLSGLTVDPSRMAVACRLPQPSRVSDEPPSRSWGDYRRGWLYPRPGSRPAITQPGVLLSKGARLMGLEPLDNPTMHNVSFFEPESPTKAKSSLARKRIVHQGARSGGELVPLKHRQELGCEGLRGANRDARASVEAGRVGENLHWVDSSRYTR